jgi:hypothetical protein
MTRREAALLAAVRPRLDNAAAGGSGAAASAVAVFVVIARLESVRAGCANDAPLVNDRAVCA